MRSNINLEPITKHHPHEPKWGEGGAALSEQPQIANDNLRPDPLPVKVLDGIARRYRRATSSLEGGDRDKIRALEKSAKRARRAHMADNNAGYTTMEEVRARMLRSK
jgi:hypothetical protein